MSTSHSMGETNCFLFSNNTQESLFSGTYDEIVAMSYFSCFKCHPESVINVRICLSREMVQWLTLVINFSCVCFLFLQSWISEAQEQMSQVLVNKDFLEKKKKALVHDETMCLGILERYLLSLLWLVIPVTCQVLGCTFCFCFLSTCLQKESSSLIVNQSRFDLFMIQLKLTFDLDSFLAQGSYYLNLTYLTI